MFEIPFWPFQSNINPSVCNTISIKRQSIGFQYHFHQTSIYRFALPFPLNINPSILDTISIKHQTISLQYYFHPPIYWFAIPYTSKINPSVWDTISIKCNLSVNDTISIKHQSWFAIDTISIKLWSIGLRYDFNQISVYQFTIPFPSIIDPSIATPWNLNKGTPCHTFILDNKTSAFKTNCPAEHYLLSNIVIIYFKDEHYF